MQISGSRGVTRASGNGAGTLIAYFGGFGMAAAIVGLFFILGVVAAPFLPETKGKPLPHALWLGEAT